MVEAGPSHAGRSGSSDFFDEEDDDEMEEEQRASAAHLANTLLVVYRNILKDISLRNPTLPPREQRELARVMEPILCFDLRFVFEVMEGSGEFVSFLRAILDAGCVGARLGLLGLLAGARYRDRDLQARAEKVLDQTAEPTAEDMKWLASEWIELYYPLARSLRPLLQRYADRRELLMRFTTKLCSEVELELFESTERDHASGLFSDLFRGFGPQKSKNPATLRRELAELNDYDILNLTRLFLGCYPEDRLTMEGHLCWFNTLHSLQPEVFWLHCIDELRRHEKMQEAGRGDFLLGMMVKGFENEKVKALLLFMEEHLDELSTLPFEVLDPLMDELLQYPQVLTRQQRLLIHLNNVLVKRLEAGETETRPLLGRIKDLLLSLAKPAKRSAKKPAKTRRKR